MRVLLTGGGTAGHINPALAIAETVKQNDPSAVIAFVGTKKGKEADLVPREGYPLYFVESKGFHRPLWNPKNISVALTALWSPYSKKTTDIIKEFQPDIVIGTGGYACWPIAAAAIRMGIPCALHESNALPGLAIRRLHKKADRIWLHFSETAKRLTTEKNILCVGNPLRTAFGATTKLEARKQLGIDPNVFRVLSYGGSIGAERVDAAVLDVMEKVIAKDPSAGHLHAAGKRGIEAFSQEMEKRGLSKSSNCQGVDYIYNMPLQMAAADLVICRAGAMTVSELAKMKKAAILIPSPNVTDNHQYLNAKVLADAGAAILFEESQLTEDALSECVKDLIRHPQKRADMEQAIEPFGKGDANHTIWNDILTLVKSK